MFVALAIQAAMRMRNIVICGLSAVPYFSTLSHKQEDFREKKVLNIKCVEIKCQLDATEAFIADLIACSTCFGHHCAHHQELKSIIQWLLPVVFRALVFKLLVISGAEGYVSGLQDAAIKTSVASSWHFISTY